jgi:hypothetical protein
MPALRIPQVRPAALLTAIAFVGALVGFVACNESDSTAPNPGSVAVAISGAPANVTQGQTATATVTVTRSDPFADVVQLSVEGAPTGLVTTLSPATLASGVTTSTLTLAPSTSVAPGTYTITVRATGPGVTDATTTMTFAVIAAPTPTIALAVSPTTLSVGQGGSGSATATITRGGGYTGAVNLAVTGAPTGVTATATPASLAADVTSATIGVAVAANTAPGTYTLTVTATGTGVAQQTATVTLTVPVPPAFSMVLAPTSVSVQQNGSVTSTATITRSGGFTGAVGIAVTGQPTGMTVTVNPTSIAASGTTATITIAPSTSVAAGSYTLTVTGSGTGVANQTATLTVNVTALPSTSAAYSFCDAPLWVAVQDGNGPWTHITATSGNTFNFQLTSGSGGIAVVTRGATSGTSVSVIYASAAELHGASGTTTVPCTVPSGKTVHGSVAGVGPTDLATIVLDGATAGVSGSGPSTFDLTNVPSGTHDLIAARSALIAGTTPSFAVNRLIIRRNLNPPDGSTLPVLDFGASESFAPATANATIANAGTDMTFATVAFTTANGTSAGFFNSTPGAASTFPYYGVPDAQRIAGDLHSLTAFATPGAGATSSRFGVLYFSAVADKTITLGPVLSVPTITTAATSPYARLRAQLGTQVEYNQLASVSYSQGSGATARAMSVFMTAGYAGGQPNDLTIPDLSAAAGWDNTWGLQPGVTTNWNVFKAGGTAGLNYFFQSASEGALLVAGTRSGTVTP